MKRNLLLIVTIAITSMSFAQETTTETTTATKMDINERFGQYGAFYAADFDAMKYGYFGVEGQAFSLGKGFGLAFGVGWTTKMSACIIKIGPTYCLPLSETLALSMPVRYAGMYDGDKFRSAFSLDPQLNVRVNKVFINVGLDALIASGDNSFGIFAGLGFHI